MATGRSPQTPTWGRTLSHCPETWCQAASQGFETPFLCSVSLFKLAGKPQLNPQVLGPCPAASHWESPSRVIVRHLQLCDSPGHEVAPKSLTVLICVMEIANQCLRAGGGLHPAQGQLSGKIQGRTGGVPVQTKARDKQGLGRLPCAGSQRTQKQAEDLQVAWRGGGC